MMMLHLISDVNKMLTVIAYVMKVFIMKGNGYPLLFIDFMIGN